MIFHLLSHGEKNIRQTFITSDGSFKVKRDIEKMSKSKYNVVSPVQFAKTMGQML